MSAILRSLLLASLIGLAVVPLQGQTILLDSLQHDGLTRLYTVHVPSSYDPDVPAPLVLNLHGGGGNMTSVQNFTQMNAVSEAEGFLLVYPQGVAPALTGFSWADGRGTSADLLGVDDVGFVQALLDTLGADWTVDPDRVHACGFSNGGFMTQRLACEQADRFASIGSLGCSMDTVLYATCAPSRPMPMVLFVGTADPEIPYGGGPTSNPAVTPIVPVDSMVQRWVGLNGCQVAPVTTALPDLVTDDNCTVERVDHGDCDCGADVRFFRILGGGHTWPGVEIPALEPQLGQTVEDIVASVELWSFFQAHPFCAATAVPAAVERVPVRVWPNPCSDQLHVDVAGGVAAQVWVRDAYGRLVAQVDGGVIPVTGWPAGLYVAETRVNGVRTGTARFMKD